MKEISLKRRFRLRSKEARRFLEVLEGGWGIEIPVGSEVETGSLGGKHAYLIGGKIVAIDEGEDFLLTIHGILDMAPKKRWVTVDMGAVRFIANGADVMSPGVIDADPSIKENDIVWIRDERNGRPLCVGRSLMDGAEMVRSTSGKGVKTLHYVGDPIWNAEV